MALPDRSFASLREAFAHYAECALATAEGLDMRKTSSQAARARAWGIADGMVAACREFEVLPLRGTPRLRARLGGRDGAA